MHSPLLASPVLWAASILCLLAPGVRPADAQSLEAERIVRTRGQTAWSPRHSRLEVLKDGSVSLVQVAHPRAGSASGVMSPQRSRLTSGEAIRLNAALGVRGLERLPSWIPNTRNRGGSRFQLEVERAGKAPLRTHGFHGSFDLWQDQLGPLAAELDAIEARLRALPARETFLEIKSFDAPTQVGSDEAWQIRVRGPGLPGLRVSDLQVVQGRDRIMIDVVGVPGGGGAARAFDRRVTIPARGIEGPGEVLVVVNGELSVVSRRHVVEVVASSTPSDGLFHGVLSRNREGYTSLRIGDTHHVLLGADAGGLPTNLREDPVATLRGLMTSSGIHVYEVVAPTWTELRGQVLTGDLQGLSLEDGTYLYVQGRSGTRKILQRSENTVLDVRGWVFGQAGARVRRMFEAQVSVEVAAEELQAKRGIYTVKTFKRGAKAWVAGTAWAGRRLALRLPGGKKGRIPWSAVEIGEALPSPPRVGIAGALPK